MSTEEKLNEIKEFYGQKDLLAELVSEHLDEFKNMSLDEIKECFLGEPQINQKKVYLPFYEGDEEFNYGIYFKMISPKLDYLHEIVCACEFRSKEDTLKPNELPSVAGMSLILQMQTREESVNKKSSKRCYGFYFYVNPSKNLWNTVNRYNLHIKTKDKDLLGNSCCVGTEIYLGKK